MNARFVIAEGIDPVVGGDPDRHSPRPIALAEIPPNILKLEKPQNGQAVTLHADGQTRIDFSDVASEKLTFVRVGDRLIVLFDNQATVTIDGVFDPSGHPLPNIAFEMAPDRLLTGDEFASLFPITTDQSVLPAAGPGGNGPTAGAHFGDPTVDQLPTFTALDLLDASPGPGNNFASLAPDAPPTQITAAPDTVSVVEAGIHPTNVPFAGTPVATGNVLTNDFIADPTGIKAVTAVGVGAGSTPPSRQSRRNTGRVSTVRWCSAPTAATFTRSTNANSATSAGARPARVRRLHLHLERLTRSHFDHDAHHRRFGHRRPAGGCRQRQDRNRRDHRRNPADYRRCDAARPDRHHSFHRRRPDRSADTAIVSAQTVTYTATVGDEGHTVLTLTPAELAAIEQAFTVAAAAGNTNNGAVNWTYSIADSALDFLSRGETVTLVSTVLLDDHNGGTDTATVTVTIQGSDDKPVIDVGVTGAVTEQDGLTGSPSPDTTPVTVHFTDPDLNNIGHSATVLSVSASGVIAGAPGTAELLSFFTIDSVTKAAGSTDGDINATFSAPDNDFDYLAAGEKLTITYTLKVDVDHAGGTDTQTVRVTVTGTDDAPVISGGQETAAFSELANHTNSPTPDQKTGTLNFSDVDLTDIHSVGVTLASTTWSEGAHHTTVPAAIQTALGSALQTALADSTGSGSGSIGWTFSLPDSDFDFLARNEKLQLVYDVTVTDPSGEASMQTVTITVTGSNDVPSFDSGPETAAVTEQAGQILSVSPDAVSGTLNFTDVDLNNVGHTATVTHVSATGVTTGLLPGILGTLEELAFFQIDSVTKAAGSSSGAIDWTFSAPDLAFDYLAAGQTVTLTYTVRVNDHAGGTSTQTVAVTVTGTNDTPVFIQQTGIRTRHRRCQCLRGRQADVAGHAAVRRRRPRRHPHICTEPGVVVAVDGRREDDPDVDRHHDLANAPQ